MKTEQKNKIWLFVVIAGFLIVILGVSLGFLIHDAIYSAKISVMVTPSIAKVKVGENEFATFGEYKMQPGEYAVEVSAEGFATKTGKIILKANETVNLNLYLISNDVTTVDWYEKNAGDALIVGEIQNAETLKAVDALIQREPILNELPLTVEKYSDDLSEYTKYVISYALDDSDRGFYLIVKDYTGAGIDAAKRKLMEMGANLENIEIKYENLTSDSLNYRAE